MLPEHFLATAIERSSFRLSPTARATTISAEDGSSIVVQLSDGISIRRGHPLPVQGRYWDSDGHVVFVTAFADKAGNIYEIEVARVDLQPILDLARADRIEFSDLQTGYYRTTKSSGAREE
ncbi:MAG: hypothetical protein HS109_20460 [Burkholderiales bacterium]|nr:hypothetical protein [Burkholderiales bacterium]